MGSQLNNNVSKGRSVPPFRFPPTFWNAARNKITRDIPATYNTPWVSRGIVTQPDAS